MKSPNSETGFRLGAADHVNLLPAWLPFAVLLGAAVILLLNWENIPDRWATHWNLRGEPDGWTTKSPVGVFLPIGIGIFICGFLEIVARVIANQKTVKGFDLSPEAVTVMAAATANLVRLTNLAMSALLSVISVALPLFEPRSPGLVVGSAFAFLGVALFLGMRRYSQVYRMLKERGLLEGAEGWNWFAYNNPEDPRLWVPKLFGYGFTINFGHRWGWPVFLLIIAIPVMVVIVIIVLAR